MLGLRTTIYKVPELGQAKSWYNEAFASEPYFDQPFYIGYNIGGFELGLLPDPESTSGKTDNVLSYWGVGDIQGEFDRLVGMGAQVHQSPTNVGGEIVVASVKDPWDNVIGLIYNPEFAV